LGLRPRRISGKKRLDRSKKTSFRESGHKREEGYILAKSPSRGIGQRSTALSKLQKKKGLPDERCVEREMRTGLSAGGHLR